MENQNFDFKKLNLNEDIIKAIENMEFKYATEVQARAIPLILNNKDIIVKSQTGSGKTAAFAIPICEKIQIEERNSQVMVLVPTRELAAQVKEDISNIGRYKRIRVAAIFGKQPISYQINELKQRVHVVVGTPGRTLDHIDKGTLKTENIKYLVIDEADEMLNMGFIEQVEAIISALPAKRVTMLFSATIPDEISELCRKYLKEPEVIEINPHQRTVENITQQLFMIQDTTKLNVLERILYIENPDTCIIFCKTKENVSLVAEWMKEKGFYCQELHGGMLQNDRLDTMNSFKRGNFRFLIATDVAARGIDIANVTHIINYDIPVEKERYVHRIGRTGRAGGKGIAISLANNNEIRLINEIENYIDMKIPLMNIPTQEEAESFKSSFFDKNSIKPKVKQIKSETVSKEIMKIYINAGKDKKIRPGDIVGAVTNIEGISGSDIGIIDIQDRFSHVEILSGKGNIVLEGLRESKIKGKAIRVDKAKK